MKKIFTAVLALLGVLALTGTLAACGNTPTSSSQNPTSSSSAPASSSSSIAATNVHVDAEEIVEDSLKNIVGTGKIYLTTFGQSEWSYAESIVNGSTGANANATKNNLLAAADVETGSTVIAVVGFTSKGLAGGITQASETARATAFGNKADANEIKLIILHLGGKARRGDSSDPMIAAVAPKADAVLIYDDGTANGGDYDKQFETWVGTTVPLYMWADELNMIDPLKTILGK